MTKILIADDVAMVRDMLKAMLKNEGQFSFQEASNGEDALRIYRESIPDIVFLDINMPGRNGMDVLETIRSEDSSAFVVILSGDNTASNVITAVSAGASGYVIKPFTQKKIASIIKNYFDLKNSP